MQLTEGTLLQGGKYKIERVLGQGGFGITYLASQVQLGRKVCIKEFFFKQFCERDEGSSRVTLGTKSNRELVDKFINKFVKEARTISQLSHSNIIRIYDIFDENNTAYYVMEYHNGGSLGDLVKDGNPLPEADAVRYITQIADAVGYIHKRNINHLDIKPGNILLDSEGDGVLIDFGLSKQYDESGDQTSSTPVGISHGYAPMEQYNPGGVSTFTPQSDIYSLGATLYKLVTGVTPPKAMDIFNGGLPALPAHLSLGVKKAIEQAMKLHKNDRPATAEEFVALLSCGSASAEPSNDEATKIIAQPEDILVVTPKVEPIEKPAPKPIAPEKKESETPNPIEKKKKKNSLWLWVTAVVVAVILGVFVWQSTDNSSYTDEYVEETPAPIEEASVEEVSIEEVAQSYQVRGRVVSSKDNEPIVGAVVAQEGTSNQVLVDIDGNYSIEIKSQGEATLVFTYIGYVTKRIKVKDSNHNLNVTLEPVKEPVKEPIKKTVKTAEEAFNIGYDYYNGTNGKQKDYSEAVKWYRKAAEQGYMDAQNNLGFCYYNGQGVPQDYSEAVKWYRKAAEQGHTFAQYNLGNCYYFGQGVPKDYSEAVKWYRKAAEQGYVFAQYNLGVCYENGQGVSQDYSEAVKWYRKAAEQRHASAQYQLGFCYYNGLGVPQDYSEAVKWYRKAAEQGDEDAQNQLGYCYQYGQGVPKDYSEAVKWYRKATEQGHATAQNNLGVCYEKGQGVSQDYSEAVKWYRKAAEQGHTFAQYNLGVCYENSQGMPQDYSEAVKWYRKAAEQGHASAQYNLGVYYEYGRGVPQDYSEAVKWYRKAAEQGVMYAQHNLGYCYDNGRGVPQDYSEAVKWYRKAAEQGYAVAQCNLGYCYDIGQGVPQDYSEAVKWYRKAAEQGNEYAKKQLQKLKEMGY